MPSTVFHYGRIYLLQAVRVLLDFEPKSRPANKVADTAAIYAASARLIFEVVGGEL
jgi:hypothetical protein